MILSKNTKAALLLVDIQTGFDRVEHWGGNRNNPSAELNASFLLEKWRKEQMPLFHIKHNSPLAYSPLHQSQDGNQIKKVVAPNAGEPIIEKDVNSAFINTNLKPLLDKQNIEALVICGLTTDKCVSTTTRMAGNLGYKTFLVTDACATFDQVGIDGKLYDAELVHQIHIASLKDEFATVVETNTLLQYWL